MAAGTSSDILVRDGERPRWRGCASGRVRERSASTAATSKRSSPIRGSATRSWRRWSRPAGAAQLDVVVRVDGGGITGQADACKLGIARALKKYDEQLADGLRDSGLLTRDSRMKERKKYGLRGARRGTQFSKR